MNILFKNETFYTKNRIRKLHKYAKINDIEAKKIIIWSICMFNIIGSIVLIIQGKAESIIFAIITICVLCYNNISVNRRRKKWKFLFEFYENCFEITILDEVFEVEYTEINNIIEDKNIYYIVLNKCGFFLDQNCFTKGTKQEFIKFINSKNLNMKSKK